MSLPVSQLSHQLISPLAWKVPPIYLCNISSSSSIFKSLYREWPTFILPALQICRKKWERYLSGHIYTIFLKWVYVILRGFLGSAVHCLSVWRHQCKCSAVLGPACIFITLVGSATARTLFLAPYGVSTMVVGTFTTNKHLSTEYYIVFFCYKCHWEMSFWAFKKQPVNILISLRRSSFILTKNEKRLSMFP